MEEGEEIQPQWVPFEEPLALMDRGEIKDAKTLLGLALLERRLRNQTAARSTAS